MSESQETKTPVLIYDADGAQEIPVEVKRGKRYPTRHTIRGCTDESYVEYDKMRNVRLRVGKDKSVETLTDREKAAMYLYGELLEAVKGWGAENGENVDEPIARMVIEDGLLICAVDEDDEVPAIGDAEADRPWEPKSDEGYFVPLRCRFNGEELVTKHFPTATPTADQKKRHEALKAKKKLKPGGSLTQSTVALESIAKPLGKLYDELFGRAEGYAGRVPLWHKGEVVSFYLEADEQQVGEG